MAGQSARDIAARLARHYLSDALADLRIPADRDILADIAAGLGVTADPVLLDAARKHVDLLLTAVRAWLATPAPCPTCPPQT
jgi:hypothetical protein